MPSLVLGQTKTFDGRVNIKDGLAVGSKNPSLESSALVQLDSTASGFLAPRMTETDRDNIGSPATGLLIYNTTSNQYNFYDGTQWGVIGGSAELIPDGTVGTPGLRFENDEDR